MIGRQSREELLAQGEIVAPPSVPTAPQHRACADQTFELPTGLYIAMALMFTGFVAVLAMVLHGGHLAVAFGVIFAFVAAYFGVPFIFPRVPGSSRKKALTWDGFRDRGIMTATGHSSAHETVILVLLLPSLVFCFAMAVALIDAIS